LRKSKTPSSFFYRNPDTMSSDERLDFIYWNPKYDSIIEVLASKKLQNKALSLLVRTPIISGKTPDNYVFPMKGIPFIGARNIRNGVVDTSHVTYIDDYIHNGMLSSSKVANGDILVTMAGSIGRVALYTAKTDANISQAVARLQPKTDEIDPEYLVHYLNSYFGQIQFERDRHDVNQPNINTTEIGRIRIILPDKGTNVQKEIVRQLSEVERETEAGKQEQEDILRRLRNITLSELHLSVPSVKVNWYTKPFGDYERLDYVWNHPTATSVKQYLENQHAIALGQLIEDEIDYGLNASGKDKGKIRFVNIEQVNPDGTIRYDGMKYVENAPATKFLKTDDILICRSRAVGTTALVNEAENNFTFGSFILRIRLRDRKLARYVVSFLNSDLGKIQFKFLQTGSEKFAFTEKIGRGGGNNINTTNLKQVKVIIPKAPEAQTAIDEKIRQLLKTKQDSDAKLKHQIELQKGLFEKLLFPEH